MVTTTGDRPMYNVPYFAAAYRGISVMAWGGPGVVKSAYNRAYAESLGYWFYQFLPSHHLPEEIAGTPVVFRDEMVTKNLPPEVMQRLTEPYAWILLDEYNTGSAMMRAVLLQLTNERTIGRLRLHPTTIVTAAANPPERAPNASPLEESVANRFMHWKWQTPVADFLTGIGAGGVYPAPQTVKFANCELGDRAWGRKIELFLESKPEFIECPPASPEDMAFPTPRTWEYVMKGCAALDSVQAPSKDYEALVSGCVGKTAATMFIAFATSLDLYSAIEVMEGKVKVDFTAPADRLLQLPSALIFHAQRLAEHGRLEDGMVDTAFSVLLEMGERGHIDAVKAPMATIATIKKGYRPPVKYRERFGSLMAQIMA